MEPGNARAGFLPPATLPVTGPQQQRRSASLPAPPAGTLPLRRPGPRPASSPPWTPRQSRERSPAEPPGGGPGDGGSGQGRAIPVPLQEPRRPQPDHREVGRGTERGLPGGAVGLHGEGRRRRRADAPLLGAALPPHAAMAAVSPRAAPLSRPRSDRSHQVCGEAAARLAPRARPPAGLSAPPRGRSSSSRGGCGGRPSVPGDARVAAQPAADSAPG